MPFNKTAPMLDASPDDWEYDGLAGGTQGECVWAEFGSKKKNCISMSTGATSEKFVADRITSLSSGGMSACSAVFLRFVTGTGTRVGAVIHYDSTGDPGAVFNAILKKYGLNNAQGRLSCEVVLVTHKNADQTGQMAYNELTSAGFNTITQFRHNGSACMDLDGNVFDHYLD